MDESSGCVLSRRGGSAQERGYISDSGWRTHRMSCDGIESVRIRCGSAAEVDCRKVGRSRRTSNAKKSTPRCQQSAEPLTRTAASDEIRRQVSSCARAVLGKRYKRSKGSHIASVVRDAKTLPRVTHAERRHLQPHPQEQIPAFQVVAKMQRRRSCQRERGGVCVRGQWLVKASIFAIIRFSTSRTGVQFNRSVLEAFVLVA